MLPRYVKKSAKASNAGVAEKVKTPPLGAALMVDSHANAASQHKPRPVLSPYSSQSKRSVEAAPSGARARSDAAVWRCMPLLVEEGEMRKSACEAGLHESMPVARRKRRWPPALQPGAASPAQAYAETPAREKSSPRNEMRQVEVQFAHVAGKAVRRKTRDEQACHARSRKFRPRVMRSVHTVRGTLSRPAIVKAGRRETSVPNARPFPRAG